MKSVTLLCILSFSLFSCKKTYQCQCVRVVNAETWNPLVTNVAIENTKKNAKTECESLSYVLGWQDYQNCVIK